MLLLFIAPFSAFDYQLRIIDYYKPRTNNQRPSSSQSFDIGYRFLVIDYRLSISSSNLLVVDRIFSLLNLFDQFITLQEIIFAMKKVVALLFGMFAFAFAADAQVSVTDDKIEALVTSEASRYDLLDIRNGLAEENIDFRYDLIEWADGQLTSIRIRIKAEDGTTGEYVNQNIQAGEEIKIVRELTGDRNLCIGDCE